MPVTASDGSRTRATKSDHRPFSFLRGASPPLILTCWESGHGHWVLPSGLDPYNGMSVRQIAGIGLLLPPTTAAY